MIKKLLSVVAMLASTTAIASTSTTVDALIKAQPKLVRNLFNLTAMDWKVGDKNVYSLNVSVINGSMDMSVREIGTDGIWVDQNMDLGFAGKHTGAMLMDANTGEIKKLIMDGKEQAIPENNMKPVEAHEDKITVPAGTFDCVYAKLKDEKTGEIAEAWINPEKVSIGGSLKMIQQSQAGEVTLELTSFTRN